MPEAFLLGDRAVYIDAFRAVAGIDPEIDAAKLHLAAVWTNDFAKKANARYPKG